MIKSSLSKLSNGRCRMGVGPSSDGGTGAAPAPGPGPALSVLARAFSFGRDGVWDKCAPSAALAGALEDAAGRARPVMSGSGC
jgi:hypothetical protein